MKTKEYYKVVERKSKVLTEYFCETCGKLLYVQGDNVKHPWRNAKEKYFYLSTCHHLWGHDSIESIEGGYYCEECFKKRFEEYMEECDLTYEFNADCKGEIGEYEYEIDDSLEEVK